MEGRDWEECRTWHELFEWLCVRTGHDDNAVLASAYIKNSGGNGRDNLDAIQKNLKNWRLGRHLPLRRNVAVLAKVLGVNDDAELRLRWNELYRSARGETGPPAATDEKPETIPATVTPPPRLSRSRPVWHWLMLFAGLAGVCLAGNYAYRWLQFRQLPTIGYDARVRMQVGQTRLIHGDRQDCNLPPPDYAYFANRIPTSNLGEFTDGGIAKKMDNACGRIVAVRAVRFTATQAGVEEIKLLGDFIKLEVADAVTPDP